MTRIELLKKIDGILIEYFTKYAQFKIQFLNKLGTQKYDLSGCKTLVQVHSSRVVSNSCDLEGDGILVGNQIKTAGVFSADCVPVVLVGKKFGVIAHCGWRGLRAGILTSAMNTLGEPPELMVLGPSAQICCYEVKEDFLATFREAQFYRAFDGKFFFSLQALIKSQIGSCCLAIDTNICTICDKSWFSFRRDKKRANNLSVLSVIPVAETT
ncbi:MAG: polyphenol oxidase family protein [Deltaproteobacteria bacterium]|nr:polyphenol oxidase family protein [Deltaproteobacteria bacterium]